jgi:hypothetical protein
MVRNSQMPVSGVGASGDRLLTRRSISGMRDGVLVHERGSAAATRGSAAVRPSGRSAAARGGVADAHVAVAAEAGEVRQELSCSSRSAVEAVDRLQRPGLGDVAQEARKRSPSVRWLSRRSASTTNAASRSQQ